MISCTRLRCPSKVVSPASKRNLVAGYSHISCSINCATRVHACTTHAHTRRACAPARPPGRAA
eukprot:985455-Pleurochrysis_carterae.AAC.1